ncbi:unnamed protein product [Polarella glacialis]|uniref:Glutathione peroxidase n=2 Tax=Polarella glacialis TaxID=89957 RepID=A0A813I6V1_POLGL|nr:unnamed protein product [Polarella glacialis]CAE8645848.1 unnamed protein product [Polarella glacialis]|mmetsp:Transcript_10792/g.17180  ORF Transcript_10792/g.17180 Transcript_10792/m.17180 type:complete len:161 (-) Transcript_10792:447-929(-)|eukprot:CAMPEP_0115076128 /NCGR_PEP_ID=MMETSP0227-20121206/16257_1 /TAXON_ID=89957 /ORGANISM="Polarella glacialis, Strain CCMP 1383" /LENGTH=160 /DNA_ID=CAMNT_0002463239 /DNA_START=259 /DNA_END=741 /DNA_ORIENTATION=-
MTKANYTALGPLMQSFKDQKVKVLLFPCNQFLGQEPGQPTAQSANLMSDGALDIAATEKVTLMSKVEVNGANASDIFEFLKYNSPLYSVSKAQSSPIPWNFSKFLVNPKGGSVYKYYSPKASFDQVKADIEFLLKDDSPPSVARSRTVTGARATGAAMLT